MWMPRKAAPDVLPSLRCVRHPPLLACISCALKVFLAAASATRGQLLLRHLCTDVPLPLRSRCMQPLHGTRVTMGDACSAVVEASFCSR